MRPNTEGAAIEVAAGDVDSRTIEQIQDRPADARSAAGVAWPHRRGVHAVAVSPSSRALSSLSDDTLACWSVDRATGLAAETFRLQSPVQGNRSRLVFMADSASLCCAGQAIPQHPCMAQPLGGATAEGLRVYSMDDGRLALRTMLPSKSTLHDVTQLDEALLCAAAPNRAFVFDVRAPRAPVARLPVGGIQGLATCGACSPAPTLLAAVAEHIDAYDLRALPSDVAKTTPPPTLGTLTLPSAAGGARSARLTSVAACGACVVAGDDAGGLHAWDVSHT